MSILAMTKVYASGLNRSQKAIALAYADHAHDDGSHIYPSVGYMAWKTGYSERAVQTLTKELVESNVLVPMGSGPGGTNKYRMDFDKLPIREPFGGDVSEATNAPKAVKGGAEIAPPPGKRGAKRGAEIAPPPAEFAPPGVQGLHPPPAEFAPEPSYNHHLNHHNDVVAACLSWMGFVSPLSEKELALKPAVALAWAWWFKQNQPRLEKQGKDPVAITVANWRKGGYPPANLTRLATAWLMMNEKERATLLEAAADPLMLARKALPESLAHFDVPLGSLKEIFQATGGQFAPPELMPGPALLAQSVTEPPDEEEPEPARLTAVSPAPAPVIPKMTLDEAALWKTVQGELRLQLTQATYNTWLRDAKLRLNGGGVAYVVVGNEYAAGWINGRLAPVISRTLSAVAERELSVVAVQPSDLPTQEAACQ